jgi:DNA-binding MarR family transcriptional regulator
MKKAIVRGMRAARAFSRNTEVTLDTPLSAAQIDILFTIASDSAPRKPSELAVYMHQTRPFITKNANVLISAGYVQKVPDKTDRRSFTLAMTRSGNALCDGLLGEQYHAQMSKLSDELGKKKFNKLIRLLDQANAILDDAVK